MITPFCYYTKSKPKDGTSSNFNDPVSNKVTNAIHDVRMNFIFNKYKFSLKDVLIRKYDEHLIKYLERYIANIRIFFINGNPYKGNEIFHTIKREVTIRMTSKFKIKFEE
jgi:hypothetical protein